MWAGWLSNSSPGVIWRNWRQLHPPREVAMPEDPEFPWMPLQFDRLPTEETMQRSREGASG